MKDRKRLYAGIIICLLIVFLSYFVFMFPPSVIFYITEKKWQVLEGLPDASESYFVNTSEWHYKKEFEKMAACAVENYSRQIGIEEEWELLHMYDENGKVNVFVRSKNYRELFLMLENDMWLLAADIQKGNALEVELMGGEWSYQSDLVWHSYKLWVEGEEEIKYQIDLKDEYYQYDSIYEWQVICALKACLTMIGANENVSWEILYEKFFVSSQGSLVDAWYKGDGKKIHLIIDVGNKLYSFIDII